MKIVCKLSEDGFEVEESKIINLNLYYSRLCRVKWLKAT